ncbi:MAG TPA: T9SS type A sorting domain-containing protein, partial [Calditrichaeota bacterium]|nr:T9SS type A sorting domain-containing protein [Calditrichota bacterium]
VDITIPAGQFSGSGKLEVTDPDNYILLETAFNLSEPYFKIALPIPVEEEGQMLSVKAYVTNGSNDASGMARIAVQSSYIKRITVSPDTPEVNQPLEFELIIKSYAEIETVLLYQFRELRNRNYFYHPGEVTMTKVNDTLFQSTGPYPGFDTGGEKVFDVYMRDVAGKEYNFRWQSFYLKDPRPDLEIDANSLGYTGTDQLQIKFLVRNNSDESLSSVKIACYDSLGIINQQPFAQPVVNFSSREEKEIAVNFYPTSRPDYRRFKIVVDTDNAFSERKETNNTIDKSIYTDHLLISKQSSAKSKDTVNETILLENRWYYYVAANALNASTVLHFYKKNINTGYNLDEQQSIQYIAFDRETDTSGIYLEFKNFPNQPLNTTSLLSVIIDTTVISPPQRDNLSFHRYDAYLSRWIKLDSWYEGQKLVANAQISGLYAVLSNWDDKKPLIEITANGRRMRDKMYVSKDPQLAFVLQDENGVNFKESFQVFIDGEIVAEDDITFPDDLQNSNTISLLVTPKLETGNHDLEVRVADVNGNETVKTVNFIVSGNFDFVLYGNYPNPFSEVTRVAYTVIGEELDDLDIKIYTTSGRLIRTKPLESEDPDENILDLNYHELIWDGTDDDGNPVGNGVYFMVVTGSFKGKQIKHTIKMARLQ